MKYKNCILQRKRSVSKLKAVNNPHRPLEEVRVGETHTNSEYLKIQGGGCGQRKREGIDPVCENGPNHGP